MIAISNHFYHPSPVVAVVMSMSCVVSNKRFIHSIIDSCRWDVFGEYRDFAQIDVSLDCWSLFV